MKADRSVCTIGLVAGRFSAPELDPLSQRYVKVHLAESVFKGLSGLLEDWILGLGPPLADSLPGPTGHRL